MWKFLESEMKVILGLTADASRTDAELADLFGLKKGTVASIRRRLLDAGAISFVNIPALNRLGCEAIGFHIGTTSPSERSDSKVNHYMDFCMRHPQIFQGLIGGTSVVFYTALRSATDYEEFVQSHNKFFSGTKRNSRAKLSSTMFPYAMTKGTFVPNFAPIVHGHFQLDFSPPKTRFPKAVDVAEPDLSETESDTLVAMVENPKMSDRQISALVGLSRQAVTRIRNKLLDDGIITTVCIPHLYKWGFEICAVAHPKFNMDMPWDRRMKGQPRECVDLSFFTLSKADEAVANYLIAKFMNYSDKVEDVLAWYHKAGAFEEPPEITLFPLDRCTELRTFEYGPVVRQLLLS